MSTQCCPNVHSIVTLLSRLHISLLCPLGIMSETAADFPNKKENTLKTNILYYTEHTLSNYWFYDPVT